MPNDDFYEQLRARVAGYTGPYSKYVLLLPDLFTLLTRLAMDSRVPGRTKGAVGAALAYVVSPIDLLPERSFGVFGLVDDVVVIVAALNMALNDVDRAVVAEHWSGSGDVLTEVQDVLREADRLIGRARLEALLKSLGIDIPGTSTPA